MKGAIVYHVVQVFTESEPDEVWVESLDDARTHARRMLWPAGEVWIERVQVEVEGPGWLAKALNLDCSTCTVTRVEKWFGDGRVEIVGDDPPR